MKQRHLQYVAMFALALLATGCSTTENLPKDEVLYTGIKRISYTDKAQERKYALDNKTGVITSLANAYNTVDNILTSKNLSTAKEALKGDFCNKKLTKEQKTAAKETKETDSKALYTASEEVEATLAYAPNNSLFGSSSYRTPFPVGLWIYNKFTGSESPFGKWIFNTFAATPVFISTVNPQLRAQVATNTLRNYGYFNGHVDYEVLPESNGRKAKVAYNVIMRDLYKLDSIAYLNYLPQADSLIRSHWNKRLLRKGDPFSVVNLDAERTRLNTLFRDNGYYYYSPEYTEYRADTVQRKGWVQLQVQPIATLPEVSKHRWYIGKTTLHVSKSTMMTDSLDSVFHRNGLTYYYKGKKMPVRVGVFRRNLMRRGSMYQVSEQNRSVESLNNLGIFSMLDISYTPRDTSATCDTLDIGVTAALDKPYDGEFEMNVTSKSNDQLGPGLSFGLAKRNVFRGGEKLSFKVHGSYEWQTKASASGSSTLFNSYEYGTKLSIDFPRLYFPGLKRRRMHKLGTTSFALDADWKNRAGYFSMVSLGASATYSFQTSPRSKHEFVPFSLDYDELLSQTDKFRAIMDANPALYVSMRNQFIPAIKYTYTYTNATSISNPYWWQTSLKESGNLTSCVYGLAGKRFSDKDKELFKNPFAQFVKLSTEYRKSLSFGKYGKLAVRADAGVIKAFGNSTTAPYSEQFYVGGANSVRAFAVRAIGPGKYHPTNSKYSYMDETGDLKFEANVEYRFPIVGNIYGATFIDTGNIWLLKKDDARPGAQFDLARLPKDLAVGTGFGLRYDMDFIVLRLDLGIGIHAPYDTGRSGYYNIKNFRDGMGLHFAVGYPF
jgi:outer membrane translocation and assembly module TamA